MDKTDANAVRDARQSFGQAAARPAGALAGPDGPPHKAKVFKSGNSLALRLPRALGLEAGMEMELRAMPDGSFTLSRAEPARRKIDISGFWGKCPWLEPIPPEMREFEERPSTIAARRTAEGKA